MHTVSKVCSGWWPQDHNVGKTKRLRKAGGCLTFWDTSSSSIILYCSSASAVSSLYFSELPMLLDVLCYLWQQYRLLALVCSLTWDSCTLYSQNYCYCHTISEVSTLSAHDKDYILANSEEQVYCTNVYTLIRSILDTNKKTYENRCRICLFCISWDISINLFLAQYKFINKIYADTRQRLFEKYLKIGR